jgi:hypothetical protein
MIKVEYILNDDKSLLTIIFDNKVLNHLGAKCDDYINFYQSNYALGRITIFKSDSGYRIVRKHRMYKTYQVQIRSKLNGFGDISEKSCSYFLKKNSFIICFIN